MHPKVTTKIYKQRFPLARLCDPSMSPKHEEGAELVSCPVCGMKMQYVTGKHLALHGLTTAEADVKYPNHKRIGKEVQEHRSEFGRRNIRHQLKMPSFREALRRGMKKTHEMCRTDADMSLKKSRSLKKARERRGKWMIEGQPMASLMEGVFVFVLKELGIPFEYEPTVQLKEPPRVWTYVPDFRIGRLLVEVRAEGRRTPEFMERVERLRKHGHTVKLVGQESLKKMGVWNLLWRLYYRKTRKVSFADMRASTGRKSVKIKPLSWMKSFQ
jgi:ssDNA-binding Zn-finger/Zn-ribbon topoisomerase 1